MEAEKPSLCSEKQGLEAKKKSLCSEEQGLEDENPWGVSESLMFGSKNARLVKKNNGFRFKETRVCIWENKEFRLEGEKQIFCSEKWSLLGE